MTSCINRSLSEQVADFHTAFGHPVRTVPQMLEPKEAELRVKLIAEELIEYAMALGVQLDLRTMPTHNQADIKERCNDQYLYVEAWPRSIYATDTVLAADALGDIAYVVAGANHCHGFAADIITNEIHHSNMSKLGLDGKPLKREDGKVLKGPGYFEPDIESILRAHGLKEE